MQKNREKSLEMKSEGFFGRLVGENVNSARSNNLVLKYQRFTPSGCKDIYISKFEFVAMQKLSFFTSI